MILVNIITMYKNKPLKGHEAYLKKIYILWMKTIHYPNKIRSHLVTIAPMAPFTSKSNSNLRYVLLFWYSVVIPRFICINDIVNSTSKFNFLMYADDTTLYFNIEDFPLQSREADINNELKKVNTWLQLNKLSLNTDKSKFMLFHKKRTPPEINISINNSDIERVSQFTFLGIVLDETLSWKNHITMITNKLSRINGVLHRLKFIFPKNILLTIYKSLFMPHINYGSLVWGNNFEAISKLQKRAIRTITHSHYIAHSEPLLKQLNLLKVKDMIDLKLLKFLHKLNASKLPQYFNSYKPYLEKNETKYNLRPNPLVMPAVNHVMLFILAYFII